VSAAIVADARRDEPLKLGLSTVEDPECRVPRVGQLSRGRQQPLDHDLQVQFAHQALRNIQQAERLIIHQPTAYQATRGRPNPPATGTRHAPTTRVVHDDNPQPAPLVS
jgi:hypothetical protein